MALRVGLCTALNTELLEKLSAAGIVSAAGFLSRDATRLSQDIGVSYKTVCSIRRVLLAEHAAYPVSALTLYQQALSSLTILSTGCTQLDQILDGGLYTGEVTELAGDTVSGKTRICHWCAAVTIKEEHHIVIFIHTCGSFSVRSLLETLTGDDQTKLAQLKRVKCQPVFDVFELIDTLDNITAELSKQESEYKGLKLVVVDNLALLINTIMGGNAAMSQGIISRLGYKLKQLASSFSLAVLVTNNLVGPYGQDFGTEQRKPALGKVWSHAPHTRIILSRAGSQNTYVPLRSEVEACLVKSGRQQIGTKVTFSLSRDPS